MSAHFEPPSKADVEQLADTLRNEFDTAPAKAEQAAFWMLYAIRSCEALVPGLAWLDDQPTLKEQRNQLERLTRQNPRKDAVRALSGQAEFYLQRALIKLGQWTPDWKERPPKELAEAARLALEAFPKGAPGRRSRIPRAKLIVSIAHLAERELEIRPTPRRGRFRRLLAVLAQYTNLLYLEEISQYDADDHATSKVVRDALRRYQEGDQQVGPCVLVGISQAEIS